MTASPDSLLGQLAAWLPRQRWFAAKGRGIRAVRVERSATLRAAGPRAELLLLSVEFDEGPAQRYQLLVGWRRELPVELEHVAIGSVAGETAYDGLWDGELSTQLLDELAAGRVHEWLRFVPEPDTEVPVGLTGRVLGVEQSNSSVAFGEEVILKLFRRVAPGVNPDLELHRALRRVGSQHVAGLRAAIEGVVGADAEPATLALLQDFAPNSAEGWAMALISIRDLFAEADLHADEVGGDFAGEARRLGETVATVHAELRQALGTVVLPASEVASAMTYRLAEAAAVVPELAELADPLRAAYAELAALEAPIAAQRIHGDLHLGQTLRTPTGWLLIDFEGEPARPLAERLRPDSALRDVAGLLRSFDYAAYHQLAVRGETAWHRDGHEPESHLVWRAEEWAARNRKAFCDGYASAWDVDPRDTPVLLRTYELDKAVYEAEYETRNRPSWLPVPLRSLHRLVGPG